MVNAAVFSFLLACLSLSQHANTPLEKGSLELVCHSLCCLPPSTSPRVSSMKVKREKKINRWPTLTISSSSGRDDLSLCLSPSILPSLLYFIIFNVACFHHHLSCLVCCKLSTLVCTNWLLQSAESLLCCCGRLFWHCRQTLLLLFYLFSLASQRDLLLLLLINNFPGPTLARTRPNSSSSDTHYLLVQIFCSPGD